MGVWEYGSMEVYIKSWYHYKNELLLIKSFTPILPYSHTPILPYSVFILPE